jgi:peptidoglycan/xylan/chitin deacetylase (PgdA/CDA1 family)
MTPLGWALVAVAVFALWFSQRYAWWRPAIDWRRPRVLMYHMVSEPVAGAKFRGLRVSPVAFERQLQWLHERGFRFLTMSELMAADAVPEKSVAITFDDGYEDNFRHALPLLQKYGAKATLYLVADRHDRDWSTYKKAHHASGELMRERKLDDAQVRALLDSGLFELGSHTLTHANLPTLDAAQREQEIAGAKLALEKTFAVPVTSFAYPFGLFGETDVAAARAAGYSNAVTTIDGIDPHPYAEPLRIRRVKISGKDNRLAFAMRMRGGKRGWRK